MARRINCGSQYLSCGKNYKNTVMHNTKGKTEKKIQWANKYMKRFSFLKESE